MTQPLGVAEYQTSKMIEELKSELPSIDDLERTVKDLPPKEELQRVFVESSKKEE